MADQVEKTSSPAQNQTPPEEVVVVTHKTVTTTTLQDTDNTPPTPPPETDLNLKSNSPVQQPIIATVESELTKPDDDSIPQSGSFKEESTRLADLPDPERKALQDLKHLVQDALNNHEFSSTTQPQPQPPVPLKPADNPITEAPAEPNPTEAAASTPPPEEPANPEAETDQDKAAADSTDDDGAKTVEAIEETIVAVSSEAKEPEPKPEPEPEPEPEDNKAPEADSKDAKKEEVSIWGIPLLADERNDVVLLKFLRARDFKVKDAFAMIKNTVRWRKQFGIDQLLDEDDLGNDLEKVVFMHGLDKEAHPVCYNVYGEFQNKELYHKTFSDEDKRQRFLRWRIQFLERSIRRLDFTPGGISTIVQVNDLKNSPGPGKWELRQATKQALQLLQDNYPEFVAKQVFINVPWWYLAVNRMISPFLTQRTKSKFVFAGPSKSAETLLRYIAAEQIPVKYGGLSKDGEFKTTDAVTEITVKPAAKHTVEFPVTESCLLTWEVRVVGWDVNYGAEFVPSAEESYTVIIQKTRKVGSAEEPVVCNSFKIGEPGKVVLTIDNPTSKKKKLLYRLKTKAYSD